MFTVPMIGEQYLQSKNNGNYVTTYRERNQYLEEEKKKGYISIREMSFFLKLNKLKIRIERASDYNDKTDEFKNNIVLENDYRNVLFRIKFRLENYYSFQHDDDPGTLYLCKTIAMFKGYRKSNSVNRSISFQDDFERDYWKTPMVSQVLGTALAGKDKKIDYKHSHKLLTCMFMSEAKYDNDFFPELKLRLKEYIIAPGFTHYSYSFNNCDPKPDCYWSTLHLKRLFNGDDNAFKPYMALTNPSYYIGKL